MKINPKSRKGTVNLMITSHDLESERIPKEIKLLDETFQVLHSQWITTAFHSLGEFKAGQYILRLTLSSGIVKNRIFQLRQQENHTEVIDLGKTSPHEDMEWAYLSKRESVVAGSPDGMRNISFPINFRISFSKFANGDWLPDTTIGYNIPEVLTIADEDGIVLNLIPSSEMLMMHINYPGYPRKSICLPPQSNLKLLIRPILTPAQRDTNPLEITIATENWKAEALLSLLKSGSVKEAQLLISLKQAEQLLKDKRIDSSAAAIGGYYLLLSNCFHRLHNWPRNLADWFPFLPDGAVIYATQLVNNKKPRKDKIAESRKHFLIAVSRGIPVYTEGLRLLIDGLTQLAFYSKRKDTEVENALKSLNYYKRRVDWTKDISTFNELSVDVDDEPESEIEIDAPQYEETSTNYYVRTENKLAYM